MVSPPSLFDTRKLAMQRARTANSSESAWFLHEYAAKQIADRLEAINRDFLHPAIVGWRAGDWRSRVGLSHRCKCVPDDQDLGLNDDDHDLVLLALSLHWSNDPVGQMIQARRALEPDGLFLAVLFGGRTLFELRTALAHGESRVEGGISPRVAPMGDIRDLGDLLARAGLALPVADSDDLQVTYESPLALMRDLRAMGETNAMADRRKTCFRRDTLATAISHYEDQFGDGSGRVLATFEMIFLSGWAPHESQPRPLRPGSAKTRLSDALGTEEHRAPGSPRRERDASQERAIGGVDA